MAKSKNHAFRFVDCWIGNRLRQLRAEHGYPAGFIADLIEQSEGDYTRIEDGQARISMTDLNILSRFYGIRVTEFFDEAKEFLLKFNAKQSESGPSTEEGLRLLRLFFKIRSPEQRELLLKHAEFLVDTCTEPQGQC